VSSVSETIVREFFELHGFLVRQQRKYIAPNKREDEQIDFFISNPQPRASDAPLPFVLNSSDLKRLGRAVVVVKGWHTETFSPAVLANAPEIFRFVEPAAFQQAAKLFGGDGDIVKILVVPALPHSDEARTQSIELLRAKGVDAAIPFRTVLNDLIQFTETNRNYQKSDILQIIRILKNYEFIREPQLELFKPTKRRSKKATGAE
jgi:hypothetical protein